jgi:uncharacterized membrane protein
MLHNKPPGTEIIIIGILTLICTGLLFGLIYSWFIMGSQSISMFIFGILSFILLISISFSLFDADDENKDNSSSFDSDS